MLDYISILITGFFVAYAIYEPSKSNITWAILFVTLDLISHSGVLK